MLTLEHTTGPFNNAEQRLQSVNTEYGNYQSMIAHLAVFGSEVGRETITRTEIGENPEHLIEYDERHFVFPGQPDLIAKPPVIEPLELFGQSNGWKRERLQRTVEFAFSKMLVEGDLIVTFINTDASITRQARSDTHAAELPRDVRRIVERAFKKPNILKRSFQKIGRLLLPK
jgi:hypothetical protein